MSFLYPEMRHESFKCAVLFTLLILASGCSARMDALEQRVQSVEQKLNDIRSFQAEQTSEIASLSERVRFMTGKLEEVEYGQGQVVGGEINELRRDVSSLRRQVPPPAVVPVRELEADEVLADGLRTTVATVFKEALVQIRSGNFRQALPLLDQAQELNYGGEGSAEIAFWKAVCYDGLGDTRGALRAYNDLISEYPKASRTALGLLRQASVFIRLGDSRIAKVTLQKLLGEFPGSTEAAMAKERMRDIE